MKDIQGRLRVRVAVFACVAAVALGIDQLTKMWAQQALGDGRTVPLIPGLLSLTLVHNPGASLGLGSGSTWLISLLAVVACVVMAVLAARTISRRIDKSLNKINPHRIVSHKKTPFRILCQNINKRAFFVKYY